MRFSFGRLLLLSLAGLAANGQAEELKLEIGRSGEQLGISWTSEAITRTAPFWHAEFQLEKSADLAIWSDAGALISGGVRDVQSVELSTSVNLEAGNTFYRVRGRLNAPGVDFSGSDFSGANLAGANLAGANLSNANFADAELSNADINGANLLGADLESIRGQVRLARLNAAPEGEAATLLPKLKYVPKLEDYSLNDPAIPGLGSSIRNAMVMLKAGTTVTQLNAFLEKYNGSILGAAPRDRFLSKGLVMARFGTTSALELFELTQNLKSEAIVAGAAPDILMGADAITDEAGAASADGQNWTWNEGGTFLGGNWGLEYAHVPEMWNVKPKLDKNPPAKIKTAVFDLGLTDHSDLKFAMRLGKGDLSDSEHGNFVAGIIGATWTNKHGIDGVNPFAEMIGYELGSIPGDPKISFAWSLCDGMRELLNTVSDLRIVNTSLGFKWSPYGVPLTEEKERIAMATAIEYGAQFAEIARAADGVLFVTSAGNDHNVIPMPSSSPQVCAAILYGVENILVVGSHDTGGVTSSFCNDGWVVMAPGEKILSLARNGGFAVDQGTSFAAAFTTGVAGFLAAAEPNITRPTTLITLLMKNGPTLDAYRSLMEIDALPGFSGEKRILRKLLDIDDGTPDGSLRMKVPPPTPGRDRSFKKAEEVEGAADYEADAVGDDVIDMSDFRRWRDWLIGTNGNNGLNGSETHPKRDANYDRKVDKPREARFHPRGDFNGDGRMDENSTRAIHGVLGTDPLEDWKVFEKSGLWTDEYYDVMKLKDLLSSVDISASAENFFELNPELPFGDVSVYDAQDDSKITFEKKPFHFAKVDPEHIFTVPVGKTYYLRSDPVGVGDGRFLMMSSINNLTVSSADQGQDYVVDLAPVELTAIAANQAVIGPAPRTARAGGEIIDSDPLAEVVDAHIESTGGFFLGEDDTMGAQGWANDQGTFYALVRTGPLTENQDLHQMIDLSSHVTWRRSFIKDATLADPTFTVQPMQLSVVDGFLDYVDLKAFAEIKVEKRGGASAAWQTIFHSKTEIGGHSKGAGGGHTFKILQHEGDMPKRSLDFHEFLLFAGDSNNPIYLAVISGATYKQEEHEGTIPLNDVPDGGSFELRYTLDARANALPFDELSTAFIGDPLHYGSGMQMSYGSFGELPTISAMTKDVKGEVHLQHHERAKFYYILYRKENGTNIPIALKLGGDGPAELVDTNPQVGATKDSYRIKNYPLDRPLDLDNDGIDDVFELRRSFLNALDPSDANEDEDGDGFTNVAEYQNGTDLLVPDAPLRPDQLYAGRLVKIGVGSYLRSADLNNDGRADLVTLSDTFEGSLMVSLMSPDGSFQDAVGSLVSGSQGVDDVILARLDDGASVDAVLLDSVSRKLIIMRGLANGRFEAMTDLATVGIPTCVAVGDVNNDGKPDFIVGLKDFKVKLFASQPGGGWQASTELTLASVPTHAAVGRFNGDNFADLAVTMTAGQVALFHGTASGGFGAPEIFPVGSGPERIAAGDLNGDGIEDFVTANKSADSVSIYLSADGKIGPKTEAAVFDLPSDVVLQDLDGDSRLDIIVSHYGGESHRVLRNLGNGQFAAASVASAGNIDRVILLDANGDSRLDLAGAVSDSQALILSGDGNGSFATRAQIDVPGAWLIDAKAVDFNGDGSLELIALDQNQMRIDVWEHAASSFSLVWSNSVAAQAQSFAVSDLNGDSRPELLVLSAEPEFGGNGTNELRIFTATGAGSFSDSHRIELSSRADLIFAGDIDGDGDNDVIMLRRFGGSVSTFINQGTAAFQVEEISPAEELSVAHALLQDIDADGRAELIVAGVMDTGAAFLRIMHRVGGSTWSLRQAVNLSAEISALRWANITGDSASELITATPSFVLGGSTAFEIYPIVAGQLGPKQPLASAIVNVGQIRAADANRDGRIDLILDSAIMRASAATGFNAPEPFWFNNATLLDVIDLNGDMKPDMIGFSDRSLVILYSK